LVGRQHGNRSRKNIKLGKALAEHKGRDATVPLILLAVCVLAVLGRLGLVVMGYSTPVTRIVPLVGGLFGLAVLSDVVNALHDFRVVICEQGLVYSKSGRAQPVRWEDITSVWQLYRRGSQAAIRYTLEIKGQKDLLILTSDQFPGMEKLGDILQQQVTQRLLPQYAKTLNQGGRVRFGQLAVDRQGITAGKKTVPWERIQQLSIRRGVVMIKQEGQWIAWPRVMARDVLNLYIFLSLMGQIIKID
jgi:hypothetical protein